MTSHDATGRSTGKHHSPRYRKAQRPPAGKAWIWLTEDMLSSPAWRVMNATGLTVLNRIILEHLYQGGRENGRLIVTYNDLAAFGVRRQSIALALEILVTLGWLDVIEKGGRSWSDIRRPSKYALSWLPRADGAPATNGWKAAKDLTEAKTLVTRAQENYAARLRTKAKHASMNVQDSERTAA